MYLMKSHHYSKNVLHVLVPVVGIRPAGRDATCLRLGDQELFGACRSAEGFKTPFVGVSESLAGLLLTSSRKTKYIEIRAGNGLHNVSRPTKSTLPDKMKRTDWDIATGGPLQAGRLPALPSSPFP